MQLKPFPKTRGWDNTKGEPCGPPFELNISIKINLWHSRSTHRIGAKRRC